MKHFRTGEPDFSDAHDFEYDHETSVYGNVQLDIPNYTAQPLGHQATLSHYLDASILH